MVDEEVAEHGSDTGERVEDLEAAALLALKLVDAALAVVGDLADGGVFLVKSLFSSLSCWIIAWKQLY